VAPTTRKPHDAHTPPEVRAMTGALALAAGLLLGAGAPAERYTGRASLEPPATVSADARFRVAAELEPGERTQATGRYALDARLDAGASAKSAAAIAACAADTAAIFSNSFE